MHTTPTVEQLTRTRWAVRGVMFLGLFASMVANILHAPDSTISQVIAAWSPLALLVTSEMITRVPVVDRAMAIAARLTTAGIALVAAWVSYWHTVAVVAKYGETGAAQYLIPLTVDGLIVVASICLGAINKQIAQIHAQAQAAAAALAAAEQAAADRAEAEAAELAAAEQAAARQADLDRAAADRADAEGRRERKAPRQRTADEATTTSPAAARMQNTWDASPHMSKTEAARAAGINERYGRDLVTAGQVIAPAGSPA